ncbi:MAG: hypothetical protein RIR51_557, partial [Bacteroidota bacterium]
TNAIVIGYHATVDASNKIQLGNSDITSVATSGNMTASGFTISGSTPSISTATKALVKDPTSGQISELDFSTITNNKVPYTGATGNVNLGTNSLTANSLNSTNLTVSNIRIGRSLNIQSPFGTNSYFLGVNALPNPNGVDGNIAIGDSVLSSSNLSGDGGNIGIGNNALRSNENGSYNLAIGSNSLERISGGGNNVAIGDRTQTFNYSGSKNTSLGSNSLISLGYQHYSNGSGNQGGSENTAIGFESLWNLEGNGNIALGANAGHDQESGDNNIAIGRNSNLPSLTSSNQFVLASSLYGTNIYSSNAKYGINKNNPTYTLDVKGTARIDTVPTITSATKALVKDPNTGQISEQGFVPYSGATGNVDLGSNKLIADSLRINYDILVNGLNFGRGSGNVSNNLAVGSQALYSNTTGTFNSAIGNQALYFNTAGSFNEAHGSGALRNNDIGSGNTAVGNNALYDSQGQYNTALGYLSGRNLTYGINNIAIGANTNFPSQTSSFQLNIGNEIYGKYVDDPNNAVLIGIGTNNPTATLEVNGTAKINNTPTISSSTKALVKNPTTGQISELNFSTITNNLVPYTGATTNVNLGSYSLTTNSLTISNTPTITTATKALVKDPTTGQISEQDFGPKIMKYNITQDEVHAISSPEFNIKWNNSPTINTGNFGSMGSNNGLFTINRSGIYRITLNFVFSGSGIDGWGTFNENAHNSSSAIKYLYVSNLNSGSISEILTLNEMDIIYFRPSSSGFTVRGYSSITFEKLN